MPRYYYACVCSSRKRHFLAERYTRNILHSANEENTSDDRSVGCATLLTHTRGCSVNVNGGRDGLTNSVAKDEVPRRVLPWPSAPEFPEPVTPALHALRRRGHRSPRSRTLGTDGWTEKLYSRQ